MLILGLGFSTSQAAAVGAVEGTLATQFSYIQKSYEAGWDVYDSGLISTSTTSSQQRIS